jgi:hypothetical protein
VTLVAVMEVFVCVRGIRCLVKIMLIQSKKPRRKEEMLIRSLKLQYKVDVMVLSFSIFWFCDMQLDARMRFDHFLIAV